eukprot:CAMPEP_0195105414 /NCGR_PEP_ID=MMETSP0448-20130528/76244_1 /TAXON_ID=66468 /ORGANISM="Heterocapsa triquestra, Strain CCMP 448" /LENGTH=39 /DNA_ID= /DNA_START= /DNA_END= /DNA_ORIENTATION=
MAMSAAAMAGSSEPVAFVLAAHRAAVPGASSAAAQLSSS